MNSKEEKDLIKKNLSLIRERMNRRTVNRLNAEVDFTYKIQGKRIIFKGVCLNISSFGMAFVADTSLELGERLLFNFKLNQENVVISGEVSRVDGKEVSVEFNLPDTERDRFTHLFNQEIVRENSSIRIKLTDINKRIE